MNAAASAGATQAAPSRRPGPRARPNSVALRPGYHSPQVEVETRLNTNESPEPPPQGFLDELAAAVTKIAANRYPDRRATALRATIAEHHGVTADQVFCANGSNEVLQCLFLAYGGAGRSTVVFEPTYALHSHIPRLTATEVVIGERDEDFRVDVPTALRLLERVAHDRGDFEPSITMLCSPNNPTGGAEAPETVAALAAAVPGLLVVDEAYGQFAPSSALDLVTENPSVVVVRTFSKTWAMAALRLGYLVAHPEVVAACEQVVLPYHLDAVKQAAGVLALRYEDEMRRRVARLLEQRNRVAAALAALDLEYWPSDANFILFRVAGHDSADVWQRLVAHSVLVRDVSGWPGLEGCLRVTIGTAAENERFLSGLKAVLAEPGRSR
ncbi:MAG TPA: histidinol-phosphate transaminase [Acidimicrobiales bacterium]|nr:histidinol-phosphate transaminase [Acidimicrobiales bacterium]